MGDLPSVRVNPANAFIYSGVDYAGPFYTRMAKGRGSLKLKGYIAVFVCMVTKAIHLELVSDLTTEAFLAAFKRFIGRRGLCKEIYSDNGTNFVGASKLLDSDIKDAIIKSTSNIAKITAKDDITWKFIPVATPHFGGLWEAGVKSVIHHIKRIFDEADIIPTFEEFSTVLVQIEACLNSRPITPMSSDPNDYQALTPGHFLIGRPLISVPEPDYKNESLHSRWRKLKDLHQLFWDRWSTEYLHTLQGKSKWTTEQQNPQIGQLVLLKQSNIPPSKWPLARIHELKPGADNKVRVVIVRHDGNKLKSTVNICPLPIDVSIDQPANLQIETQQLDSKKANKVKNINSHSKTKIVHKRKLVNNHEGTPSSRANPVASTLTGRQKKKRRIAPCLWARSLLSTILTFMMFLSALASNDTKHRYEIIKPDSGYYIENLGKSQVLRGNLRLEIPFPMADILSDEKNVLHTFDKTNRICEDTKEMVQITHCDVLLKHLKAKQLRISRQIEQLKTFVPSRSKRGILGKFLTTVFGVNDEVYENIDNLDKNQRMLLHLTSQQHLQVSTSLQQMNNATKNKLEQFSKKIDQLVGIMNGMKPWYKSIDDNKISIQVISAYLTASDYYNEVEFKYQNLVNAMYGQANIMHFFPTNTILDVIDQVSEKLGPLFQIIRIPQKRIDVSKSTDCLEVHGYFYITDCYSYDLIHVSSIPFKASPHEFITPIIKTPTLAINFNQHLYFEMEDDQFRNCILTSDIYLCSPSVIANINTKPNCVIDEVYQRFNKSGCPMSAVENTQLLWKQLMMPNTWSFATDTPTLASITCNGVREEELLTDVGILRLKGNCLIQTDHYTLRLTFDEQRRVLSTFSKKIQLPKMESLAQQKLHVIDLPKIGQQMFEPLPPGTFTDEIPRMHTLAIHTAAASGTTTIIAVVLIVVFILKKRKTRKLRTSSDEMTLSEIFNRIFANQKTDSVQTTNNEASTSSVV